MKALQENTTFNRSIFTGASVIAASLWLATAAAAASESVSPRAVGCKPIRNAAQLQAIQNNLAGTYCLTNDIDAGSVANFVPIGDGANPFTGRLFGNGRVIRNLTIDSGADYVGLFGAIDGALIQDVGLVNADIVASASSYTGGLVGHVFGLNGPSEIRRVHVTGRVAALTGSSTAGGIVGVAQILTLMDSWNSASVNADANAGGAIGAAASGTTVNRVHARGPVACPVSCFAGGLVRLAVSATVTASYATGPVIAGDSSYAGGLVALASNTFAIRRSHALGKVTVGAGGSARAGGLIGGLDGSGTLSESYAVGPVTGGASATLGGLVGTATGGATVTNAYWDTMTSKQMASATGVGLSTAALRAALPSGFGNAWAITAKRSYPFLNETDIDFAAPLATLVKAGRVYTFLPISQRNKSQYAGASTGANIASLAAVYTMIARAIGIAKNVAALKDAEIDKYFWNDAAKTASWKGPVTTRATLGTLSAIGANAKLNNANVIGEMKIGRLVILRGSYTRANGAKAEHWLLGTLYTTSGNVLDSVIANDPWTGMQVTIDPVSKTVVWPADFPLASFKVDGYQPVILN